MNFSRCRKKDSCTAYSGRNREDMIYTITFNPALDYFVSVKDFCLGKTNRTEMEYMLPGGKGINVSTVLANLGLETTALGFVAGFTGDEISRRVQELGIHADFIKLAKGMSRINFKLLDCEGTEINGMGPEITEEGIKLLFDKLDMLLDEDVLVLAGSIPKGLTEDIYMQILKRVEEKNVKTVVDATGKLFLNTLSYHPFLVKPNQHELGQLFGVNLSSRKDVIPYAEKLRSMGARNVLVSLAGQGAVLVDETGCVHESPAPEGTLVNGVGAGDSMVAGFLAGYLGLSKKKDFKEAFYTAIAAGSASAFSKQLATKAQVMELKSQLT